MCENIKVRDNNIRECAPFAKFAKIIDRKHFAMYGNNNNNNNSNNKRILIESEVTGVSSTS